VRIREDGVPILTAEQVAALPLPAKVRYRWLLKSRPKQRTPGPHALCDDTTGAACKPLLDEVLVALPNEEAAQAYALEHDLTLDPDEDPVAPVRAHWLDARGHRDWQIWLILAGRGWGKTRTGAEDVIKFALENPGCRIALVAPTFTDGRDTMVEGESGILGILPASLLEDWNRSIGELVLTNGSRMKIFSAEKPERLRGPQHHRAWADELAAWEYLQDTWDMMMFGLRLGENPQVIITTTPKPLKFLRNLRARAERRNGGVIITTGSMYENARNLARAALQELKTAYEGTRLGRQELRGEILDDFEGALWTAQDIHQYRLQDYLVPEPFDVMGRTLVGVDPAVSSKASSNKTGIIVVAKTRGPCPFCHKADGPHALVLDDRTTKGTPLEWGTQVIKAFDDWRADRIVVEKNQGGDLVISNLRTIRPNAPIQDVTATRGKVLRAEPVAALYQQGKVHHVGNGLEDLEEELTTWDPEGNEDSPDRLDALVWALTKLMVPSVVTGTVSTMRDRRGRGRR
jgi:phage terminase large subunit-like protein